MNLALARHLRTLSEYTPAPDLEKKLKLGRDALFRDLEQLIEAGYNIEFHPYLGVKFIDIPDRLLEHEILDDLNTKLLARRLVILESTASTNEAAWELAEQGCADGTVVLAEQQTQGRGRLGREWHSPPGSGVWMSVVCRVSVPPDKFALLTAMASLAIANMLHQFVQLPAEIKWPNDVMIRGRKVAGVLVEARSTSPDVFVLGLGLNVNQAANDWPEDLRGVATSLRAERPMGAPVNRVRVIRPLLFYLDSVYQLLHKRKYDKIARAWSEFVPMGGRKVRLTHAGSEVTGTVLEVDPALGITLKLANGEKRQFAAESVSNVREA